jgi:homoserine O-succinyltransferase/O-acetyltransferase
MPLTLWQPREMFDASSTRGLLSKAPGLSPKSQSIELRIGLLNNMPDSALEATERQYVSLLEAASGPFDIKFTLFSLPGIPRGDVAMRRIQGKYVSAESMAASKLDGLIVTGREPLTQNLADEPYWTNFVEVLKWAQANTWSTIWSCLAAHAAVFYMDGITRVRGENKHCGLFECARVADHPITRNVPPHYRLPHSRWNGIPESELTRCGYKVLVRAGSAGVDSFVREGKERSLFLFFQGHLEYESETLLLEFRRDVNRYLRGEGSRYPNVPEGYFEERTLKELNEMQRLVGSRSTSEIQAHLERILSDAAPQNGWHPTAVTIYRNWLEYIALQKGRARDAGTAKRRKERPIPQSPVLQSAGATMI